MISKEKEFFQACSEGNLQKVKNLYKSKSQQPLNINYGNPHNQLNTGLSIACEKGLIDLVGFLLLLPEIDVNKGNKHGETPLVIACSRGNSVIVKMLFASGREIERSQVKMVSHGGGCWRDKYRSWMAARVAREEGFEEIAELVEEYVGNRRETILKLRRELSKIF